MSSKLRMSSEDDNVVPIRYIDIDSRYRDRTTYPLQSEFIVMASQDTSAAINQNQKAITAKDPISLSYPIITFSGNTVAHAGIFVGGTRIFPKISSAGSSNIGGYYDGAEITNLSNGETSRILNYVVQGKQMRLEQVYSTFAVGDMFQIKDPSTTNSVYIHNVKINPANLIGMFLVDETIGESRRIVGYSALTKSIDVDDPFSAAWNVNDLYSIVKELTTINAGIATSMIDTKINLDTGLNFRTVVGSFLDITEPGPLYHEARIITSYDPTTGLATINKPFPSVVANPSYKVIPFSYDNSNSLGSATSNIESGLYTVNLLTVILPNVELRDSSSIFLSNYPYVYVEFGNANAAGAPGKILSNNPNAKRALFKAPIFDTSNTTVSAFVKVNSVGMAQTITFDPSEDVYLRVSLPDGTPLTTTTSDTVSPVPPDASLQISATFSLVRVTSLTSKNRNFPLVR